MTTLISLLNSRPTYQLLVAHVTGAALPVPQTNSVFQMDPHTYSSSLLSLSKLIVSPYHVEKGLDLFCHPRQISTQHKEERAYD